MIVEIPSSMVEAFQRGSGYGGELSADSARAGLEAAMAELHGLEKFVRAAAKHVTTDDVDEWNDMVDAWDSLPADMRQILLKS